MTPGCAGRILVLMAHPDDEFALFPWIARARASGANVICAWLTDGAWGGQDPLRREAESRTVLRRMGVPDDAMLFAGRLLSVPDGTLQQHVGRVLDAMEGRFLDACRGGEVWCPAWEGGHQDHDACHVVALVLAARANAQAWQFPLYHGKGLQGPWFRVLSPLPTNGDSHPLSTGARERLACIARCLSYRSQWKSFAGLLPFYALRMLGRNPFSLQPARPLRVRERPHEGALLYERRSGVAYDTFRADMRELLTSLGA